MYELDTNAIVKYWCLKTTKFWNIGMVILYNFAVHSKTMFTHMITCIPYVKPHHTSLKSPDIINTGPI